MTVQFHARGNRGEIWLYDPVGSNFFGDGITAKAFQKELAALGKVNTINVHINSPGGDVFDGFAIYNQLAQHPARIEVDVDGVAASIASIIAMAGDEIRIAKNATIMIHNPRGFAAGDEKEMQRVSALLKTIKGNLVETYKDRTGNDPKTIEAWMDDETWFTAESALENGFVTSVTRETAVSACFDMLGEFKNVPASLKRRLTAATEKQPELNVRRARVSAAGNRLAALLT
jgi:ATP-dependent Clp protease protease subunit